MTDDVQLVKRLRELTTAVTRGPAAVRDEFTMRIPAEPRRDADLVLSSAADVIERLTAERDAACADSLAFQGAMDVAVMEMDERGEIIGRLEADRDAQVREAFTAVQAWVDWCAENEGRINGAIQIATIHGCPYTGKSWPLEQSKAYLTARQPAPAIAPKEPQS